jgi:hypothetical protein
VNTPLIGKVFSNALYKSYMSGLMHFLPLDYFTVFTREGLFVLWQVPEESKVSIAGQVGNIVKAFFGDGVFDARWRDHIFVAAGGHGLKVTFQKSGNVEKMTQSWGGAWWAQPHPQMKYFSRMVSLYELALPHVRAALTRMQDAPGMPQREFEQRCTLLTLDGLAACLLREGDVFCSVGIEDDCIIFDVINCPFCLNQLEDCRLWHGVIDGVLLWINGVAERKNFETRSTDWRLEAERSTAHRLVIRIG